MNSIGHINGYLELVESIDKKRRDRIIVREMFFALLIMLSFNYLGKWLLWALDVDKQTILISNGLILFLIAIRMIFPGKKISSLAHREKSEEKTELFIFPIATPMIAGPSVCTTIMLYAQIPNNLVVLSILIAWALSITILFFAEQVRAVITKRALMAIERLMGLLLTMMAVEMLLKGIKYVILFGP